MAGVTQVAGAHEGRVFHNRMLHILKVAQLARRTAERILLETKERGSRGRRVADAIAALGGLDPDVAEAAALAHDLGHPPFGHVAEVQLDKLVRDEQDHDGFEGNAQSFRILVALGVRPPEEQRPGLDPTRATLRAVLKYPWFRALDAQFKPEGKRGSKWGAYRKDGSAFDSAMKLPVTAGGRDALHAGRSLEAEVMDWADEVTYALHDLDDFYRAGVIPLEQLVNTQSNELGAFIEFATARIKKERKEEAAAAGKKEEQVTRENVEAAFKAVTPLIPSERYVGSREQQGYLQGLTTQLIGVFTAALKVGLHRHPLVWIDPDIRLQVEVLKELTWRYVILRPGLATQQKGQQHVIEFLFQHFFAAAKEAAEKGDSSLLPPGWRDRATESSEADGTHRARTAADIVSSLTEQEAVMLFRRLSGFTSGSILDWLPT